MNYSPSHARVFENPRVKETSRRDPFRGSKLEWQIANSSTTSTSISEARKIARMKQRPRVRNGVPVLLGTQTLFNIGFYAVVPFLALVLTEDFGLAGAAVGLILGVRTFAQQGLFIIGGTLADRFGARSVILVGCAVRALGFFTLAASLFTGSAILWLFVTGTLLTGFGGALFPRDSMF